MTHVTAAISALVGAAGAGYHGDKGCAIGARPFSIFRSGQE
ncbi:hypothetical protein [Thalassospira mesophila]|nr:hypothetical protein [Thalassospira mesophila]